MVRRLEAEGIRDSLLRVSGELDQSRYGPTVSGDSNRRGVYVRVQRNSLDPFLRAFDFRSHLQRRGVEMLRTCRLNLWQ